MCESQWNCIGPSSFSVHYLSRTWLGCLAECGAHGSCRRVEHTLHTIVSRCCQVLRLCRLCVIPAGLNFELHLLTDWNFKWSWTLVGIIDDGWGQQDGAVVEHCLIPQPLWSLPLDLMAVWVLTRHSAPYPISNVASFQMQIDQVNES